MLAFMPCWGKTGKPGPLGITVGREVDDVPLQCFCHRYKETTAWTVGERIWDVETVESWWHLELVCIRLILVSSVDVIVCFVSACKT